nr:hypothetical protein [Gemmatimonadaceae bacterium]
MHARPTSRWTATLTLLGTISLAACQDSSTGITGTDASALDASTFAAADIFTSAPMSAVAPGPVLVILDESTISNGNEPNDFSDVDVNDDIAQLGQRRQLRYFEANVGRTDSLYSGETGDEGFHILK